ncbi:MAG: Regulatory sensor-transducer, BlaR1/MecR1 family [Candidatus Carbobacillus altaicus]|uniref:Regulatory sensor-transducer, BlaR1/MecR1 family n=1 Tax=Candidatus Carbonibacillus altaicus TaxID=2163959 RepID=A0A2R6XYG5_9BACL|nr:MAG: Regulatory sensor-transducer, BlaR1/MecR1 family [Candidatus Carbobacillus altaicus]
MNSLQNLFTTILNMSLTASFVTLGVILVRLLLRKAPKVFSYVLWAAVFFRLLCPFSFTSELSILTLLYNPQFADVGKYVPHPVDFPQTDAIEPGMGSAENAATTSLFQAVPAASVHPMQIWMTVLSFIWIAGVIVFLLYSMISYLKIKRKLQTATLVEGNLFETDAVDTAFVFGFVRPKIYVPVNIGNTDLSYILEHERTHIRRRDYLIKPLAFLALILHWFNPLVWLSFVLMSRDMEMSCDESVLRKLGDGAKGGYSNSLLSLSIKRSGLLSSNALAFGENHVRARIKNVLSYKKPAFLLMILAVAITTVVIVAFIANPKTEPTDTPTTETNAFGDGSDQKNEEQKVLALVEAFGKTLQKVSLTAPKDLVATSIEKNYSQYVTPELLQKWKDDPQSAPGREVSSPWPDRIVILRTEMSDMNQYTVYGEIIELTSVELANGGVAAKRPVTVAVQKVNDRWLISGVTIGGYAKQSPVVYKNTRYGFYFYLPESWKGYSIVEEQWEGTSSGERIETGPQLLIRHPNWTQKNQRQDIPIMVFTHEQWNALQNGDFSVSAAPIGPSKLGSNSVYVFALPARYNDAFQAGFEEVEEILKDHPLWPMEPK